MKALIITPECFFGCEMVVTKATIKNPMEIKKIYDESIALFVDGKYKFVSLSDFRNTDGQTIGDFLLEKYPDFAEELALLENEDLAEY